MGNELTDSELSGLIGMGFGAALVLGAFFGFRHRLPWFRTQRAIRQYVSERLLRDLVATERLTIPEILRNAGAPVTFLNKGRAIQELGKLCLARQVIEEEPAGCTYKDRLDRRTYRLARQL